MLIIKGKNLSEEPSSQAKTIMSRPSTLIEVEVEIEVKVQAKVVAEIETRINIMIKISSRDIHVEDCILKLGGSQRVHGKDYKQESGYDNKECCNYGLKEHLSYDRTRKTREKDNIIITHL